VSIVPAARMLVAIPNRAYPPDPDVLLEAEVVLDSISDLAATVFAGDQRGPATLP
jgi:hypothetical protein